MSGIRPGMPATSVATLDAALQTLDAGDQVRELLAAAAELRVFQHRDSSHLLLRAARDLRAANATVSACRAEVAAANARTREVIESGSNRALRARLAAARDALGELRVVWDAYRTGVALYAATVGVPSAPVGDAINALADQLGYT